MFYGDRFFYCRLILLVVLCAFNGCHRIFEDLIDAYQLSYMKFDDDDRSALRLRAKRMFEFAYDNYMLHAFPMDELDPIHCRGRGPDHDDPANININDVLGDYSLSLIDSLTTLIVMGNRTEFLRAVQNVIDYVDFNKENTVQVFEATIRVLGALLSAHLAITDPEKILGDFCVPNYDNQLLTMAHDLANRLIPAFEYTQTGLPFPRVNLAHGVDSNTINQTCTSGAGSLLVEFGVLSRLLGDPVYENLARRTNTILWSLRDKQTGLLGNVVDVQSGEWIGLLSGLGAGLDSFYEYLLKAYILFGHDEDFIMFNRTYTKIKEYQRRGRQRCNRGIGDHPMYVNVHMHDGTPTNSWIDALQAAFAGVQVLNGEIEEAVCHHALYYGIWKKYGVLPERYNWHLNAPDVSFYPLRPEFAESTYLLYMATKNPFYLHVGREIIDNLNNYTKVECGYATVHNVVDKSLEDRMESFFLSETCKYLYLLFDHDNPLNRHYARFLFTTEGHMIPISHRFHDRSSPEFSVNEMRSRVNDADWAASSECDDEYDDPVEIPENSTLFSKAQCETASFDSRFQLPMQPVYFRQLYASLGLVNDF